MSLHLESSGLFLYLVSGLLWTSVDKRLACF